MPLPKLTRLELRIMQTLWNKGRCSIRELLESFPEDERLAYTTVQTVVNRLEEKKAIRRVKKISNAHIFQAVVSRESAQGRMIDELVAWLGGTPLPIMTNREGSLSTEVYEARKALRSLTKKDKSQ